MKYNPYEYAKDPVYKEVVRCQRRKHQLPEHKLTDELQLPTQILPDTDTVFRSIESVMLNTSFICKMVDKLEFFKEEPPHIFWHKKMSYREAKQQTMSVVAHSLSHKNQSPWRVSWWYAVPSNSGRGLYLICFDYPDLVNLINDGV